MKYSKLNLRILYSQVITFCFMATQQYAVTSAEVIIVILLLLNKYTCLYVLHNKKPDPSMKISVEQSNNNGNDQWRKDNMTYILPGEGEHTLLPFYFIYLYYIILYRSLGALRAPTSSTIRVLTHYPSVNTLSKC